MSEKPYRDAARPIEERVGALLGEMTIEEKLAQLGCAWITSFLDAGGFSPSRARQVASDGIGEVTRLAGATALRPGESAEVVNQLQRYLVEGTRLGIPALVHEEGLAGFLARDATVFPQAIGLASSWNPPLLEQVAAVVREQMRAVGARHCLAPVLDVARDPRWGRVEETYGEDPVLTGALGASYVRGLQGEDLTRGVLATGKHFLAHALPEGGRNHAPVQLGPRELRDVYAEPFAAAIAQAGLGSVMNSYSSVDGLACAGSRSILTDLLRGELGFDGLVVADYFAVSLLMSHHHTAADKQQAATQALNAGLDVELPETDCFGEPLRAAIEDGRVSPATIDAAVRRVLRVKFELGLFEAPYVDASRAGVVFDTADQRRLARRAAAESMVLLTNDGVLPLARELGSIAVIGPGADDPRLLQGDYHYPAHHGVCDGDAEHSPLAPVAEAGADADGAKDLSLLPRTGGEWQPGPYFTEHVTPLAGIRELVGASIEVRYARGCSLDGAEELAGHGADRAGGAGGADRAGGADADPAGADRSGIAEAVRVAAESEVAIVVVAGRSGLARSCTVGEARDATDLEPTGLQNELVAAVAATGVPTVVVVLSGRVHALGAIVEQARALLLAWPPGEEGGRALAEVLFGVTEASGRLPVSLPRNVGQLPRYLGHRAGGSTAMFYGAYTDSPTSPLFPFGHGLGYTSFDYGELVAQATDTSSTLELAVEVANAGRRRGTEVVQLYASDLVASVARPERQLVGFARLELEPGERRKVVFGVHPSRLGFFAEDLRRITEPGEFRFEVGASSADLRAGAVLRLDGEVVDYPLREVVPTSVRFAEADLSSAIAIPDSPATA